MRSSLTEINGSWPVLVGLLDSFGVRNISTGTLGASPPMDLRVFCLIRALAVPQNKLANVVGERDLNIATGRLWQCNLNRDKLDFRVVNPVFSGDFIARILIVALNRVCNSSSSYWSNSMSSISNVLRISLGFSLTPSDVANSSRSITDLGNNILTDLFILNLFSFTVFLVQTFSVVGTHFCVTRTSSSVYFSILRH